MRILFMISVGVVVGGLVGAAHFGGLAWTVRRFVAGQQPGVVAVSFLLRMGVTALAVIAVARWMPLAALGVIPGVILARSMLIQRTKPGVSNTLRSNEGIADG